jgi:hypothetical protein
LRECYDGVEMQTVALNLYRVKEVGGDYIVLADDATDVRITFADVVGSGSEDDNVAITKEEHAQFFKHIRCQVGLETPVVPLKEPRNVNLFLDHFVDLFGLLRSVPFPFLVSRIEVSTTSHS